MKGRDVLNVCHMIRLLSEKANLPIILIGTPEILQILNTSPQMGIFASQKIELAPLNWNHRKQRLDFRRLLYDVEKLLPFMEPSNLSHESIASFIHRSTGGNIGRVMNLVKTAGRLAIEKGCNSIDRNLLEEAHRRFEWPILNYKNPFQEKSLLPDYNRYLRSRLFRHKSKGGQSADGPSDSYGV